MRGVKGARDEERDEEQNKQKFKVRQPQRALHDILGLGCDNMAWHLHMHT